MSTYSVGWTIGESADWQLSWIEVYQTNWGGRRMVSEHGRPGGWLQGFRGEKRGVYGGDRSELDRRGGPGACGPSGGYCELPAIDLVISGSLKVAFVRRWTRVLCREDQRNSAADYADFTDSIQSAQSAAKFRQCPAGSDPVTGPWRKGTSLIRRFNVNRPTMRPALMRKIDWIPPSRAGPTLA